jgi:polysaccharide biosynthesis protein PslL
MTLSNARNSSVDIARCLGIVLVVLGHNQLVLRGGDSGLLFRTIFSFHVPLFFFLSGLFVKPGQGWARFVAGKADALLKPYLVVLLAWGLFLGATRLRQGSFSAAWLADYGQGLLYGVGASIAWTPLWFLPCLFLVCVLSYPLIRQPLPPWFGLLATAALWVLGVALLGRGVALPWSLDLVPLCATFFMAGHGLRSRVVGMRWRPAWALLAGAGFLGLNWGSNWVVDLNERVYEAPLVSTLRALLGIFVCLQIAVLLAASPHLARGLAFVGTGSLFILLFHGECQGRIGHFVERVTGEPLLACALGFAAGVVLPLLFLQVVLRQPLLALLLLPRRTGR